MICPKTSRQSLIRSEQLIKTHLSSISQSPRNCAVGAERNHPLLIYNCSTQGHLLKKVESFKNFGAETSTHLSFVQHTDSVYKKAQQRPHLLRKLRTFYVIKDILTLIYHSLTESTLTFHPGTAPSLPNTKLPNNLSDCIYPVIRKSFLSLWASCLRSTGGEMDVFYCF